MLKKVETQTVDAIVIGAGITGMYQVYALREMGFSVKGYDGSSNVGGTWYWNRYPGCRLDTESYTYGYFGLKGIIPEWKWSERFAGQPEMLRYCNYAADKMDIRKNFQFNTRVVTAHYNESTNRWDLALDDGSNVSCLYLISAVGPLSATRMPNIAGIDGFKGESFHTSRWPRDPADPSGAKQIDYTGKRVGVIGTGATGVQVIPIVAKSATELFVFQRSPNWCTPLGNTPITGEEMDKLRSDYENILAFVKSTPTGFPYERNKKKASQTTPEERQELFESLYDMPGYGIWLSGYRDLLTSKTSNSYLAEFIANKIRQRVKDPVIAEKLIPKDHPFGTKRVPMETYYYEIYNEPNVHLVDVRETPITRVTPEGLQVGDKTYELDVLVYATGFDAVTGSLDLIDIRGKGGVPLKQVWDDGPLTYLGLQVGGFPNFFTLVGPHNGATFCNVGVCGGLQVEWVSQMLGYMRDHKLSYSEPETDAQEKWTQQVYEDFSKTLLTEADAWWVKVKTHPDGTQTRRAMVHVSGGPEYRKFCDEVASNDYEGFVLK
ncbi:NAD(P)/FAD-dependent oxidoreductase [Polaromonas sp.]|uniref:flavin-containing monooxygenase n=1 Tax=Polaromonas sp. TaxID=1869339 RepID=UPI0027324FF0|nr:NAD(P)/FAD-dependent oxidoreductase [Polaromonas sp.]